MNNLNVNNNNNIKQNVSFKGLTRTLRHNYIGTLAEIEDVFKKHPKANDIAGSLPFSWIKQLAQNTKEQKGKAIKAVYEKFREIFSVQLGEEATEKQVEKASKDLTKTLRQNGFLSKNDSVVIQKTNFEGAVLENAYILSTKNKNSSMEKLFVKKFRDLSKHNYKKQKHGLLPETAFGLHSKKRICDEHLPDIYWGDKKGNYFASKYEVTNESIKLPDSGKNFLTKEELKEYFQELRKITSDEADIEKILSKYGFQIEDLHQDNVIVTNNKKGNPIIKLIDLGDIYEINGRAEYWNKLRKNQI